MKNIIEKKVTGGECAEQLGVSQEIVTAVKKMLGISGCRRIYPSAIHGFLKRFQDFQCADARDAQAIARFAVRHPGFKEPNNL